MPLGNVRDRTREDCVNAGPPGKATAFVQRAVSQGANAASAALLAFILLLLPGTQVLSWQWTLLLPLAAAAVGLYRARKRLPSPYGVAQIVDHRVHLADTLSTALYFSRPEAAAHGSPDIRRLQSERADRLAESVDVRQAVPYTMPRTVYLMAALFLVASSLFALRYGLSRRLDLKQPLASMLQQTFGADEPAQQAKNQRRMRQPEPQTQPDDTGSAVEEPDQKQGDQQDADSANAEEAGDSRSRRRAEGFRRRFQEAVGRGRQGRWRPEGCQGDDRSGDEGDDSQTSKANDGKSDQKQDSAAKQDSNNSGENSSLMSKVKDFAQNLLSRVKPQQGQSGAQQQSSQDPKNSQGKGQQQGGKQQSSKEGQQQNGQQGDAQEGQAGEQAQNAQDPQGKGTGKSDAQQPSKQPGSGIGSQDGDKNIKQAQDLAAMGKISEIFGKRSATISGESTVEVQHTSQQLHTPYAQRGAQHAQGGAEIRRDEVPVALESYVEQYFEQVRKQAPAAASGDRKLLPRRRPRSDPFYPMVASTSPAATVAPSFTGDCQHAAGARCLHLVLHLHGLHHHQALAGFHRIAGRDQDAHHFAGHGRGDALRRLPRRAPPDLRDQRRGSRTSISNR